MRSLRSHDQRGKWVQRNSCDSPQNPPHFPNLKPRISPRDLQFFAEGLTASVAEAWEASSLAGS